MAEENGTVATEKRKRIKRQPGKIIFPLDQEEEAKKVQAAIPQSEQGEEAGGRYNVYKVTKGDQGFLVITTDPTNAVGRGALQMGFQVENLTGGKGGFSLTPERVTNYLNTLSDEQREKILAELQGKIAPPTTPVAPAQQQAPSKAPQKAPAGKR